MADLITVTDIGDYLQRPVLPAAGALAVAGASGAVRSICRWSVTQEVDVTLSAAGSGTTVIGLPTLYLTAVDEVRVDGQALDPGEYSWSTRGQLYRASRWARWTKIEVDCTHGYPTVPDVLKLVCCGIAARTLTNPESLKIAAVGSVQRTFAELPLSALESSLLDEYRLP